MITLAIAILFIIFAVVLVLMDDTLTSQPTVIALIVCATALLIGGCTDARTYPQHYQQCTELTKLWCDAVQDCDPSQARLCSDTTNAKCDLNRTTYAPIALDACRHVLRTHTCNATTPVFINDPAAQMCIVFLGSWREEDTAAYDSQ